MGAFSAVSGLCGRPLGPRLTIVRGVALTVIAGAILAVFELHLVPATRRGFFCDDQSIRYPYAGSTISSWLLIVLFLVIPVIGVVLTELCYAKSGAIKLMFVLGHFVMTCFMTGILTDVIKQIVGRLRPHFIAVCDPDVLVNMTCDSTTATKFITDYKCLNKMGHKESDLFNARLSFPSGHASLAMCSAAFIMVYTWRRAPSSPPHLGRLFLLFLFLVSAGAVCVSRVMDYKHHPGDVFFGFLLGTVTGLTSAYVWWNAADSLEAPSKLPRSSVEVPDKIETEINQNDEDASVDQNERRVPL